MNMLLFSNGKVSGNETLLQFGLEWIEAAIQRTGAKRFLFIPYAMIRGNYDDRLAQLEQVLNPLDAQVIGIHHVEDPVKAVEDADAFIVSGGNTWVLNKQLHDLGLVRPLRKAILKSNKLYVGWSAGTNIACPTIRTTNDMPIVSAAILPALNLVPFQINPHYIEAAISGHMGETRDERIEEFLIENPHEIVAGIPEGTLFEVDGETLRYHSPAGTPLKLFRHGCTAEYFAAGEDMSVLMQHGC
ncbi:dipeptidase E [Vibrio metoecus]|uniref:dipeptidase PepE n=1 Tax=Vibrio TaxID=662 RepID=UPI0006D7BB9A|nr:MULTISPECIES: dipeptidase PepE [Vibrio]KQB03832.1 alpha-aspartyl dipeptidase [Vibrio metoecus]MDP4493139.1 dipeptidase PepE [Vibrio sp. AH4]PAR47023.1 dipeptidase E [Vibrio metoecus]